MQSHYRWVRGIATPRQGGAKLLPRLVGAVLLASLMLAPVREPAAVLAQVGDGLSGFKGVRPAEFVPNAGQFGDVQQVLYQLSDGGLSVWLTPDGVTYSGLDLSPLGAGPLDDPSGETSEAPQSEVQADTVIHGHAVKVHFVEPFGGMAVRPGDELPTELNWLVGDSQDHVTGIHAVERVTYEDVWDGIDLHLTGMIDEPGLEAPVMKQSWIVAPGADPADIALRYEGADGLELDDQGRLVIGTSLGQPILEDAPVAFQWADGVYEAIGIEFALSGEILSFAVAGYDASRPLYIDPTVRFSRDFGGTGADYVSEMQVDATGRYFTGFTFSTSGFPTPGGFDTLYNGVELFAVKFDANMTSQQWGTFLGTTGSDYGGNSDILGGELIVVGHNASGLTTPDGSLCGGVAAPSVLGTSSGGYDINVYRLNSTGSCLTASLEMQGSSTDYVADVERAANGSFYLTGTTLSTNFLANQTLSGSNLVLDGSYSAWIARLNSTLTGLNAGGNFTYIPGGNSTEAGSGLAFDGTGNVYAYGTTVLSTPAFQETILIGAGGGTDLYVGKYDAALTTQSYLARIGGVSTEPHTTSLSYTGTTIGTNIANSAILVDSSNQAWLTGFTASSDWPTTPAAFSTTNSGGYDVFVMALNAAGNALAYSTFIGGSSTDGGKAIALDVQGNINIAGTSLSTNYPTTAGEVQTVSGGSYDIIRTIIDPQLAGPLICSTYWGGSSTDHATDIYIESLGDTTVAGFETSTANFPIVPPGSVPFGTGGSYDGLAVRLNCAGVAMAVEAFEVVSEPFEARPEGVVCTAPADFLEWTVVVSNNGLSDQQDLTGPEIEFDLGGPHVALACTADSGTCTVPGTGSDIEWNGALAGGGGSVTLILRTRIQGGLPAGTTVSLQGQLNFDADADVETGNEVSEPFGPLTQELDCLPTVDPNSQLGKQVHLPILNFQGQDDVCRTWIEVQYIGCDPSKAVLVTWGEPGFCPPQAAGPLKVECTGLLNPGSTWNLLGAQIPTGSKSGILFKFTAQQLSDIGLADDLGFDDVVADLMCETLFFGVVGDSDDYRRFKKAYNEGIGFAGIDQALASGTGILAVEVLRHCPGDVTPGVEVSSKYNGIAGSHLGHYDPVYRAFGYYVPLIYADMAGLNTVMYIQNGGIQCSSVEIWFKAQDDCLRARICEIFALAPGESYQWDATDCVGPGWQGSAWLRSSQELGIAVDIYGRDVLMTYIGEPQPYQYVFEGEEDDQIVWESASTGEKVAYGPLMYSEYQGWDTGVQVQNLGEVYNAKVKVYFLDRSGDVITTLVDWICPRGSQTFFLPVVADLPGSWVGSIRIESQDWWTPGTNEVSAPDIAGVATLIRYSDVARTEAQEAIAYNLLPEHKAFDWQVGFAGGGTDNGVALIAIPSLLKDLDNTGTTSELAIMNLVSKPGFTDFAIYIYDQNGLLDYVCQKLHDRQVEYIDLQTWGYVSSGFKGSAIIRATFWEHEVFDGTGFFLRNLVGLGAVSIERTGTRLGEDVPGDEAAGSRGIPFAVGEIAELEHCFADTPRCPGQPEFGPAAPTDFQGRFNVNGGTNGNQILDNQTQSWSVEVTAPGCVVEDVDLELDITHTWVGDMAVTLAHEGTGSMFSAICGSADDWLGTLDDDVGSPGPDVACGNVDPSLVVTTQSGSGLDGFDGKDASGTWTLSIQDTAAPDTGTLEAARVFGDCQ